MVGLLLVTAVALLLILLAATNMYIAGSSGVNEESW